MEVLESEVLVGTSVSEVPSGTPGCGWGYLSPRSGWGHVPVYSVRLGYLCPTSELEHLDSLSRHVDDWVCDSFGRVSGTVHRMGLRDLPD